MLNKQILNKFCFLCYVNPLKHARLKTYSRWDKRETAAEQSWHSAFAAMTFASEAHSDVDVNRAIRMLIVKDIVVIKKSYFYQEFGKHWVNYVNMFAKLPLEFRDELTILWAEYERGESETAKFARAMNELQPITQEYISKGRGWEETGVKLTDVFGRLEMVRTNCVRLRMELNYFLSLTISRYLKRLKNDAS